jgi:hypothetical protein
MLDVVDRVDDYVENLGLLVMAAGAVAMAARATRRWERMVDALFVSTVLAVVASSIARSPLNDVVLVALGGLVGPLWTVRLARTAPGPGR